MYCVTVYCVTVTVLLLLLLLLCYCVTVLLLPVVCQPSTAVTSAVCGRPAVGLGRHSRPGASCRSPRPPSGRRTGGRSGRRNTGPHRRTQNYSSSETIISSQLKAQLGMTTGCLPQTETCPQSSRKYQTAG